MSYSGNLMTFAKISFEEIAGSSRKPIDQAVLLSNSVGHFQHLRPVDSVDADVRRLFGKRDAPDTRPCPPDTAGLPLSIGGSNLGRTGGGCVLSGRCGH